LFPVSPDAIKELVVTTREKSQLQLNALYKRSLKTRTFDNTINYLDKVIENVKIAYASLYVLSITSPDKLIREAAQKGSAELQEFFIDLISLNQKLFEIVRDFKKRIDDEAIELTPEQAYFLEEFLKDFLQNGLQLPPEKQEKVRSIKKELAQLSLTYDTTASSARGSIACTPDQLAGLEKSFIDSLERNHEGACLVTTDYSQFFKILEQADVVETRKRLYRAFMTRGYPQNEKVLQQIIRLSDELAKLLGYTSYADYALADQMAKSTMRVEEFLTMLYERSFPKASAELNRLRAILPPSIILNNGKFQPWDLAWVYNYYKKNYLALDEAAIAEYFPLRSTLPALMKLYEEFFGLSFRKTEKMELWSADLDSYAVYKKGHYLGTVILDLFPRPYKFTHAAHVTIVPTVQDASGKYFPGVMVLLANFTPDHKERPSLLKRTEVVTFFHEFGHVIHALLGATELASTSGTSTKGDFVEMPSQMLEEWLWDPRIVASISSHYQTKRPLPDDTIKQMGLLKHFDVGESLLRQIYLASVSLAYYQEGAQKDLQKLWKKYHEKYRPFVAFDESNRGYCSFPHITSYGPRYYGYLWSRVFALDLFAQIKFHGLRNPLIGTRYVDDVLSKGGSLDPELLLKKFLGRVPSTDAFFEDVGLQK